MNSPVGTTLFDSWNWTHAIFGAVFFIVLDRYFGVDPLRTTIILLIVHTLYEWKDYHVTYRVYDNDPEKIKAGRNYLTSQPYYMWTQDHLDIGPAFHMPPNNIPNSIGDTIFYVLGIAIGYYYRDSVGPVLLKVLTGLSAIYWIVAFVYYVQVYSLGLHDKDRVDEIYRQSR